MAEQILSMYEIFLACGEEMFRKYCGLFVPNISMRLFDSVDNVTNFYAELGATTYDDHPYHI